MVVTVQVSDSEWSTVIKYWKELQKHLNQPDDREKTDFLNRVVFELTGLKKLHSQSSVTTTTTTKTTANISSISVEIMSEIMNEIDNELDKTEKKIDDDEMKIDDKIKTFIVEPV